MPFMEQPLLLYHAQALEMSPRFSLMSCDSPHSGTPVNFFMFQMSKRLNKFQPEGSRLPDGLGSQQELDSVNPLTLTSKHNREQISRSRAFDKED